MLGNHNLTHLPNRLDCDICNTVKMQPSPCRKENSHGAPDDEEATGNVADALNVDHCICENDEHLNTNDTCACIIKDRASNWVEGNPAKT